MTRKDQVFVADVVLIDPTLEIVATNVIIWPKGAIAKLSVITKIHKYKKRHEGHHFIPMVMKVHGTHGCDMDHFIEQCVCLFHNRWSKGHLSLFFFIQFFKQHVNIAFQRALTYVIKRKIALAGDACSKLLIYF
jgi:hypothetical protein